MPRKALKNLLRSLRRRKRIRKQHSNPGNRSPLLEALEQRHLLAVVTVDTSVEILDGDTSSIAALQGFGGSGADERISLREAITAANNTSGADTITFDATLDGTPLLLSLGEMEIAEDVTIQGSGPSNTIIDAQSTSRIFSIPGSFLDVTIAGVTLQNGEVAGPGGAVNSTPALQTSVCDATTNHLVFRVGKRPFSMSLEFTF